MYSHLVIRPKKTASIHSKQYQRCLKMRDVLSLEQSWNEKCWYLHIRSSLFHHFNGVALRHSSLLGGLDVLSEPSGWYQTFQVPFKSFHFQQAWCSEGKVTERGHLELVDSLGYSANGRVSFLVEGVSCDWWGCCNYHHVGFDIGVYVYTVYQ